MKAVFLVLFAFVALSSSFGQGKGPEDLKMKQVKVVKSTSSPVTHAEARAVFERAWKALVTGLKVKGTNPVQMTNDNSPVTKNEVLVAFKAIVAQVQPMFKRSATRVTFNVSRVRKDLDMASFSKLIEQGFVMPVGPMVVGKNGTVSTREFGDAVGVLLIRIADLTHMPSRKFSPALMRADG